MASCSGETQRRKEPPPRPPRQELIKMPACLVVEDSAILKFVDVRDEQRRSSETLTEDLPAAADDSDNSLLALRDCLSSADYSVEIFLPAHLQGCTLSAPSLGDQR